MKSNSNFDTIIIGGSYAGLSAAMALGRSRRDTLIVDSGSPCNAQTPYSHNFITQDGEPPAAIASKAKAQVLQYETVQFLEDTVRGVERKGSLFSVITQAGETFDTKKLVLATGITDVLPAIKGFSACWGISVIHCPYCHGYEFRGKKTGVLANGEKAFHIASLVNNLTDDITVLTAGKPVFDAEQLAKLDRNRIRIVETGISQIEHENGRVRHVVLDNGVRLPFDAVYAAVPFTQHSEIPALLGCEPPEPLPVRW